MRNHWPRESTKPAHQKTIDLGFFVAAGIKRRAEYSKRECHLETSVVPR